MGPGLADELTRRAGHRALWVREAARRAALFLATLCGALDRPLWWRVARGLGDAARGDLGTSLTVRPGMPVSELLWPAAARSAVLLVPALLLGLGTAMGLAWATAGRSSRARRVVQALSAPPVFLMAFLLVMGINDVTWSLMQDGALSRPGWFALPDQPSLFRTALAVGVLAWASGGLAELHAGCEDELVRVRESAFIDGALALGERVWPIVLRNLLPPLCTLAAGRIAALIGGLVVIEKVMLLNGAGALLWEAALRRDYPLAMGIGLAAAGVVSVTQLVADLLRLAVDPRLRAEAP